MTMFLEPSTIPTVICQSDIVASSPYSSSAKRHETICSTVELVALEYANNSADCRRSALIGSRGPEITSLLVAVLSKKSPECREEIELACIPKGQLRYEEADNPPYMKSSSISLTELYFSWVVSSSSSTSAFRNKSYERASFSALRASASSRSAFFCKTGELH